MIREVVHFTGKGRVFKVTEESGFCWRIFMSDLEQECWVPKTEYVDVDSIKTEKEVTCV
jgi:hypothetical protein